MGSKIQSFKQVEAICRQALDGKVKVYRMPYGRHEHGAMEVHLIVGLKLNPSYDPNAKIGPKSERFEADRRILFIKFGEDESWLLNKLRAIKESAARHAEEVKVARAEISGEIDKSEPSSKEMLEAGKMIVEGSSPETTADPDEENVPVGWDDVDGFTEALDVAKRLDEGDVAAENVEDVEGPPDEEAATVNPMEAIDKLAKTVGVLAQNVEVVNSKIDKLAETKTKTKKTTTNN